MDNNKETNGHSDRTLTPPTKPNSARSSTSSHEEAPPIPSLPYEIPNPYANISEYFKKQRKPYNYSNPFESFPVYVETLTGAVFEVMCNQFEPILGIKSKIYRLEGIPVSKQNLLYTNKILDDNNSTLGELKIGKGARLKLVLDVRGGPVSQAKSSSQLSTTGVSEYSFEPEEPESDDSNTNIVFSHIDGKAVLIVIEKEGEFTEDDYLGQAYRRKSMLEKSIANLADDSRTNIKMRQIRQKMNEKRIKKRLQHIREGKDIVTPVLKKKISSSEFNKSRFKFPELDNSSSFLPNLPKMTRVKHDHDKFCSRYNIKSPRIPDISFSGYHPKPPEIPKYFDIQEPSNKSFLPRIQENNHQSVQKVSKVLPPLTEIKKISIGHEKESQLSKPIDSKTSIKLNQLSNSRPKRLKCQNCRKKIGLGMDITCRCNLTLCTKCRTAEAHNCTFDYKSIGRSVLKKENPLVAGTKLPKIE